MVSNVRRRFIEGRKIDSTFYPVIYGADENDDWTDPEVWKKANPSLGITVSIDKVQAACDSAKQNPGEENAFRQLRLNQWVKQAVRWMPMEKWDACAFPVNEDDLENRVCYGELMKLTLEQKLAHGGHPVLRWMMDNIYIRNDPAGNIKADKEKSTEKIGGAIATIMGLDRAIRCGNDVSASVYDERGILFI